MEMKLWLSDKETIESKALHSFLQRQINRLLVGRHRYGTADKSKKYMTRLIAEVKAYKKTGNMEHLINAANYCFLESIAPEHKNLHYNSLAKSVTRKE